MDEISLQDLHELIESAVYVAEKYKSKGQFDKSHAATLIADELRAMYRKQENK